jgi:hypothetical protein
VAAVGDLWRFYDEHAAQARQHENLRATVTSTLAGIAAAVVGLAGLGGLHPADIPAGIVVTLLGVLGVGLSTKHYERNRFHTMILKAIRDEVDETQASHRGGVRDTRSIRDEGVDRHRQDFRVLGSKPDSRWIGVRLHLLWLGLPFGISLAGILVIVLGAIGVDA